MADPQARRNRMTAADEIRTLAATKSWGRGRIYDSITETIGDTPLVRLNRVVPADKAQVLVKLEFFNPLSSASRTASASSMIDALEARGLITPGGTTLIEPTSGNTGIALAFVAAARGYRLILVMPETMSHRAPQDAAPARRRAGADARRRAACAAPIANAPRSLLDETARRRHAAASSRTRPIREIHAAHDGGGDLERHRRRQSTSSSPASAPAARITGVGQVLKPRRPSLKIIAVEPAASPVLVRRPARPAQDPGHRRRLRSGGARRAALSTKC